MAPIATIAGVFGVSNGTVVVAGTIILVGGVMTFSGIVSKSKKFIKERKKPNKDQETPVKEILTEDGRYEEYKSLIEDAIENKDFEYLEEKLNSKMRDFPDLIEMIKKTLDDR